MWKWVLALLLTLGLAAGAGVWLAAGGSVSLTATADTEGDDAASASSDTVKTSRKPGGFAGLFGRFNAEPEATPVQIAEAEVGDLTRTVAAPGSIEPRTLVQISSQVTAKITALPFREGDEVQAGDVVVRLDPQNLVAQLASAEASLRIEEARLDGARADEINARLEYERLEQLYETGDASRSERDAAEARYLQALSNLKAIRASIEVAQAGIERVQKDLDNTVIESPISGTVTALNTEVGETAIVGTTNTPGSVIMEIADRSSMLLKAQVDETNIAPVDVGQGATVYINAYDDRSFDGRVEKIGLKRQVSTSGTGFFVVDIALSLDEGETLLSGLSASTDIAVETFFDVVKVPSQAVLDRRVDELPLEVRSHPLVDRDRTFARVVYRFDGGKAVVTPVRVGASDLTHTAIDAGLEAGEAIVVGPFKELASLKNGQAIRDERETPAEEPASEGDPAGDPDTAEPEPEKPAVAGAGEEEPAA